MPHRRYAKIILDNDSFSVRRALAVTVLAFETGCVKLIAGQFQTQGQKLSTGQKKKTEIKLEAVLLLRPVRALRC